MNKENIYVIILILSVILTIFACIYIIKQNKYDKFSSLQYEYMKLHNIKMSSQVELIPMEITYTADYYNIANHKHKSYYTIHNKEHKWDKNNSNGTNTLIEVLAYERLTGQKILPLP